MSEWLTGIVFGITVGIVVLLCFAILIGIGEIISWYDRRKK